jgi:hypothetical protein
MPANDNWTKRADAILDPRAVQQLNTLRSYINFRLHIRTSWSHVIRRALDVYTAHVSELMEASPMKGGLTVDELTEQVRLRESKVSRDAVEIPEDTLQGLAEAVDLAVLKMSPAAKAEMKAELERIEATNAEP